MQVDNFHNPRLREQLAEAKLSFPVIVKPQVACGVPNAHDMVLVYLSFYPVYDLSPFC